MPQILVVTDLDDHADGTVVYRERVSLGDLQSDHFSGQLVERVGWAMMDAEELELGVAKADPRTRAERVRP